MFQILVAEDDLHTRQFICTLLKNNGYTVHEAGDGVEALEVMEREHIDLVVLDIMMPRMDGYQFTESLRAIHNQIPILMLSAKQLPADKRKGFLAGTDDYMTKPFDEEEMILRIKALLRRSQIISEKHLWVGDVDFDYDCKTVTRGGVVMEVPQKEFLLIYKLLSYPGKLFTRIQLMDEIWGSDSESGPETVTVHIGRIRKRFEDFDEFEIQSVRGLGYRAVKKV